ENNHILEDLLCFQGYFRQPLRRASNLPNCVLNGHLSQTLVCNEKVISSGSNTDCLLSIVIDKHYQYQRTDGRGSRQRSDLNAKDSWSEFRGSWITFERPFPKPYRFVRRHLASKFSSG